MSATDFAPPASRRTITVVTNYEAAEQAVDFLSDRDFPVEHVRIVGTGLRYVEQVSRRVTTGNAALLGAGSGALLGLFWGLLFGLFFTVDSGSFFGVLGYSLAIGVIFGAIWGAIAHSATGGQRDFASTADTRADRYEVQVDADFADRAEKILNRMPRAGLTAA
ncbi:glycine zipper family protein [Solirubrobacter ginsenosidimutans]|uniref:Glycine zipper family protein n=1 Tax=Solirubrobacter ginsenosidimutans TaxID=490573 RepID=A0A9X3MPA6_9ACTN|nr:general stress protein [Solirubrobacter ginsenosidimutans]MDA0159894.1 glycine zipper family protein [Solirubrobacter ginsenosidimutans]